jgi:hypothetical protein
MSNSIKFGIFIFVLFVFVLAVSRIVTFNSPMIKPQYVDRPIIVSAFYAGKNKYDTNGMIYYDYMKNFLPYVEHKMVIFVENKNEFVDNLEKHNIMLKPNIILIERPIAQFLVAKYDWDQHYLLDPEKNLHSTHLYKVWNEKVNFMKIASELYPSDNYYVWTDIGVVRDKMLRPFMRYFPDKNLEKDKMHFLRINRLDVGYNGTTVDVSNQQHISGGIFAGYRNTLSDYHTKYYEMLDNFFKMNIFAGKDQNVIFNLTLRYPEMFVLTNPSSANWMHRFQSNKWFYMINHMIEEKKFITCKPLYAGIANILFHIFSSYGYACQTNRVFFLTGSAISSHSKIDYTDILFDYFVKINPLIIGNIDTLTETRYDLCMGTNDNPKKNYQLQHYLQNEKYFDSQRQTVLYCLHNLYNIPEQNKLDYTIHVRRGDYIGNNFLYVDLTKYYHRAIKYIKSKDPLWQTKKFTIISNDIEWCVKEKFLQDQQIDITYLVGMDEFNTLKYMVCSKYGGIASNSTYSWWGLWLNKNDNALKILPFKWNNQHNVDIFFKGSTVIEV